MALYASPYPRALDTATVIGAALGLDPVKRDGLAEMDVGRAAGYRFEDWAETFPEEAASFREERRGLRVARRGERPADSRSAPRPRWTASWRTTVGRRARWSSSPTAGRWPGSSPACSAGPPTNGPRSILLLDNCSVTEVEIQADGAGPARILYKNEIGHLSPDPDAEAATGDDRARLETNRTSDSRRRSLDYRRLGETGMRVSEVSLGTWAFGEGWGAVSDEDSYAALNTAVDLGVNLLDTADVYGDGRSEKLIGRLLAGSAERRDLRRDQGRPSPRPARRRRLRPREPLAASSSGALRTWASRPSTSSSSTARRRRFTVGTRPSRRWTGCRRAER